MLKIVKGFNSVVLFLLASFILFGCNNSNKIKVNIPKTFCGHVYILIDHRCSDTTKVNIDNQGIGFLKSDDAAIGNPLEFEITCGGKDITSECTDVMVTMISTGGIYPKRYLSFTMQCEKLNIKSEDRFDEIRNTPKVDKWLNE